MLHSSLSRKIHFSAAHRYIVDAWDEAKNREHFGLCYSEHGHGHNYVLEATVSGPIDSKTGMILNLADLDILLKTVTEPLDHSFLNTDIEEFKSKVPTTENIALWCFDKLGNLLKKYPGAHLDRLRLYENDDLYVEVQA